MANYSSGKRNNNDAPSLGETDKSSLSVSKRKRKEHHIPRATHWPTSEKCQVCVRRRTREKFVKVAMDNCRSNKVRDWLMDNCESDSFFQLTDMFDFLKRHIEGEEMKYHHCNEVDIIFMAHGSIRGSMMPACCLLPLPTIADVLLYAPWNCSITPEAGFGIATGCMAPQDRIFHFHGSLGTLKDNARPTKLPDRWNSMKEAGDEMVPTIWLSPFEPSTDRYWKEFQSLVKTYGSPDRDRIVIPYILPGQSSCGTNVPLFVVTLALSLVLRSSRFRATLHLNTCLTDLSMGKFDRKHLKQQYACAVDNTTMTFHF